MTVFILYKEILPLGRGRQMKILLKITLCFTLFIHLQVYGKRSLSHVWLSIGNTTSAKQISYTFSCIYLVYIVLVRSWPLCPGVYFV